MENETKEEGRRQNEEVAGDRSFGLRRCSEKA
jgi:hypothetical protein